MLVYRVFPYVAAAGAGVPGHPDYLHRPQGHGRLDNPSHYDIWYFAVTPEAAVGEVFADITTWAEDMFAFPKVPGARRDIGVFEIADDTSLLDLDDAGFLYERGLRPTQVIARNRAVTQGWALDVYNERGNRGQRRWDGVRWWSFQRPHWTVIALWYAPGEALRHQLVDLQHLTVDHPAVRDSARSLGRVIR